MTNNISVTFGVGDTTRAVYNLDRATQIEFAALNSICSAGHSQPKGHFTHEIESRWPLHFKHSHWWKRRSRSKFASHYAWGTNGVCEQPSVWMQDGCEVYMDSYMASNGSCFMLIWTIFNNHILKVGLTLNQETIALRTLTTVNLFCFIMREDPHE
jgi:hypothetical protein